MTVYYGITEPSIIIISNLSFFFVSIFYLFNVSKSKL